VPRGYRLDEQPGLSAERQYPDQGRIQRELYLAEHAWGHRERDGHDYRGECHHVQERSPGELVVHPAGISLITPSCSLVLASNQLDLSLNKSEPGMGQNATGVRSFNA
jgi:hypothetical protein